jgi:malonyl-CoA/methylmalonyl-CoA synthetase
MNTCGLLLREARAGPQRAFLHDGGETYSYAALDEHTARIACFLRTAGLKPGDRVAAQTEKSPQALFFHLACLRAGLCYVPLNSAYQRDELAYFIGDAAPRLIVCAPERAGLFRELAPSAQIHTLDGEGRASWPLEQMPAVFEDAVLEDHAPAMILYTSGTTGRSKGAVLTHGNLSSNAAALRSIWRIEREDVLLHALPIFHIHGLFAAVHPLLLAGAQLSFHARFEARAVLDDLRNATLFMGVPTFYTRLLQEQALDRSAVADIRLFISGSAPLLRETFAAWERRTGHRILERYGMSEAGMIASNPYEGERRAGTVGFPLPGVQVRVVDSSGDALPAGEAGEIQIRGPNVFSGYWRMPDKTAETFTADGWFKTGDVGQWDAHSYLSIVGRAKDLIISGGYNVYPREVELAIDALPGVVESAVIGTPHSDWGEAVVAIVVSTGSGNEAALIEQLRPRLAAYKLPKRIHFATALPRNAMGKVQKNLLRERYA